MSDAPETIWACDCSGRWNDDSGVWGVDRENAFDTEYRRADLPPTREQIMADERVQELVEALLSYKSSESAAADTGSVDDYEFVFECWDRVESALASLTESP